ncbi:MAG TPA: transcriptional regulator [Lachnospiraceae bacterium]|nr:transcriptional regulator [Lachnospiraceae bacterium]
MVFSSLLFLFRFLPLVLILYYAVPRRLRNLVLLLVSLVFYAWGEPVYVILMIVSILISWAGGLLVDHFLCLGRERAAKVSLALSVAAGLSLLGFFKYADFVLRTINNLAHSEIPLLQLALPIGISFYTFQTISYIIDVYRGSAKVQKNIISYGAYVTMFPQLIAGPIVQYKTIDRQLRRRKESSDEFALGVMRFMEGLGKKVLLANNAGLLWDTVRAMDPGSMPVLTAWIGIAAYTFQIYFDFSGYSDMAIGLGHMFGFRFLENFDHPYESRSASEFWRRWHISLGTWFREYVYIPLGGSRAGTFGLIRSTMAVWLLTGIWHGADWNFCIWGIYYGVILLLEKLVYGKGLRRLPAVVQHIYCMLVVMVGWFIFSYNEITGGMGYLAAMFGGGGRLLNNGSVYLLYSNAVLLIVLILGSTSFPARLSARILGRLRHAGSLPLVLRSAFVVAVFLASTAYLVSASYNPFLYFRF